MEKPSRKGRGHRMEAILEIISAVASANDVSDAKAMPDLLQDALIEINQVGAESA